MRVPQQGWVVVGLAALVVSSSGCTCAYVLGGADARSPGSDATGDLAADSASPSGGTDAASPVFLSDATGGDLGTDAATPPPATDAGPPSTSTVCGDPYAVPPGPSAMCGAGLTGAAAPTPTITGAGWSSNCDTGAGYTMDVDEETLVGTTALRVVGVYEATWDRGFQCYPAGEGTIDVSRPGDSVLVLSSYQPTHWTVTVGAGATLSRIILNGFFPQSVTAPSSVPVDNYSGDCTYLVACAYAWPSDTGGCDTPGLVASAEMLTGLTMTSFHGCYAMSELSLY
jgi:hypothetical protein